MDEELDEALQHRNTPAVLQYIASRDIIDFTAVGKDGLTLFNYLAHVSGFSDEDVGTLLRAVVQHIEIHPKDTVDWGPRDFAEEFIVMAARQQRLSLVYPLIKHMPYYGDKTVPIELGWVWRWDWEGLDEEEQKEFRVDPDKIVDASRATGQLFKRFFDERGPDTEEVRQLVRDGADVMADRYRGSFPILIRLVWVASTACVLALLEELTQPLRLDKVGWSEEQLKSEFGRGLQANDYRPIEEREVLWSALEEHLQRYPPIVS